MEVIVASFLRKPGTQEKSRNYWVENKKEARFLKTQLFWLHGEPLSHASFLASWFPKRLKGPRFKWSI
jgi:hypothetical protein